MSPKRKISIQSSDGESGGNVDYKKKRERNNLAVKKCREKLNEKAKETKDRVKKLKAENSQLEGKIEELKKTVKSLKSTLLKVSPADEREREIAKIMAEVQNENT